jgi:hypothetical protein
VGVRVPATTFDGVHVVGGVGVPENEYEIWVYVMPWVMHMPPFCGTEPALVQSEADPEALIRRLSQDPPFP